MRAIAPFFAALSLTLIACGGNEAPPATPATSTSATPAPAGEKHEEHGAMSPAIHDFHEVLAPMWHATPGTERVGKTCAGIKDLTAKASAVADAELTADVAAVQKSCDGDKSDVEAKMSTVHDRFHAVAEKK